MRYLAIAGRRRAGKDTAINGLRQLYYPTVRVEWAGEIKRCAARWYGLTAEQIDGDLKEAVDPRYGKSPRDIMRLLGTEVGRSIWAPTWSDFLFRVEVPDAIRAWRPGQGRSFENDGLVLISGTRFPEEVAAVHARGGRVVRVTRPGLTLDAGDSHVSESGIDALDVDADVTNDGTPGELAAKVHRLVTEWWP